MNRFFKPVSLIMLLALFITTGQGCFGGGSAPVEVPATPVTLEYWRVFDGEDAYSDIISRYRQLHPNVTINYKRIRFADYDAELIRALAEGRGPDILNIHNTRLREFQNILAPMPDTVTISESRQTGGLQNKVITVAVEKQTLSQKVLKQAFVDQVAEDVILDYQPDPELPVESRVYGLPMSLDSMVLYYNRDLLNAARVATPPQTWEEFQQAVIAITAYDAAGEVTQSGGAIGTAENVERSTDLLTLLMMQNGSQMTDERGRITFNLIPKEAPEGVFPALDATEFYTDFANQTKEVYTWNKSFPTSFEAFANGQTAFFFGYSYHLPLIKTTAPKLNFGIGKVPQISGGREVNFANYWVESVAKNSKNQNWAWDFVQFAAQEEQVASYLQKAHKPTALRNLIGTQVNDEELGVFAEQTLTARSWYRGNDATKAETALKDLINAILLNPEDKAAVINLAAKKVAETYR